MVEAIVDGTPVDWEGVSTGTDQQDSSLGGLRTLQRLADAFRESRAVGSAGRTPDVLFRWGPLEVRERLGVGSFGEVFRAYDPALDREVALKLRRDGPSRLLAGGREYVREAQRLAKLRHPNVVSVHGAGIHDGRVGFWSDLIDGRTLRDLVTEQGPLGAEEAASVGVSVCRALAAVHGAGLLHGDVKPGNVMRERGGRIVLMDFGAASVADLGDRADHSVRGTPAVLAPEVVEGGAVTPASDLYSLAALLYFLVSGSYPLHADSFEELRRLHRAGKAVPLRDRRPDLPGPLVEVVDRALSLDPAERFASAGAMERALLGVVGARPAPRRSIGLWAALAAVGVLLFLAGFAWWRSSRAPDVTVGQQGSLTLQNVQAFAAGPGAQGGADFSPDGRMLAYVDDADGTAQVWIRSLAGGEPLQITHGEEDASRPRWSSRDEILFSRGGGIWSVAALGGEARQVAAKGVNPDVSPDGSTIVFEYDRWLWTVSVDGGTPQRVESVPRRFFLEAWATPAFSPDGAEIAYFMQEAGPVGDLWVVPIAGGEPRRLTFDRVQAGAPAWTPDGEGLVFWSRRQGTLNLWRLELATGKMESLTTGVGEDTAPSVSPDGTRLAFNNTENRWILTGVDPDTGEQRELLDRRLPVWVPEVSFDGRRVSFFQAVGPAYHLFTLDLATSGLRQVTTGSEVWNIHPRWSWDDESLYYYQERPQPEFRRVSASGGESELIADGWDWLTQMQAVPSPDETRIAYVEHDPDGGSTVVWNPSTDDRRALPEPHIHTPQWSPDGATLIGFTHAGEVRKCALESLTCVSLTDGFRPRFSLDGRSIYFHRPLDGRLWELWKMGLDGDGERRLVETGPHGPLDPTFALAADGQVIYTRYLPGDSDLWIADLEAREQG